MPSSTAITPVNLASLVGGPSMPTVVDVRIADDFAADERVLPGTIRRDHRTVADWAPALAGKSVAVVCQKGLKLSQGVAAWLRHVGADAHSLTGGFEAWREDGRMLVTTTRLPRRDALGRTAWVTRARPKIDRIACPWLIRRFIDPNAIFLYVDAAEVLAVADRFGAAAFDIEGAPFSHHGERCSFDAMIDAFSLHAPALDRLAEIVRGADTGRPGLTPQSAGLLAAAQGLASLYDDDLAQLEASLVLYDALYRWCLDAEAVARAA